MIKLGDYNTLRIARFSDYGAFLDAGDLGDILMPKNYVDARLKEGDEVRVFVYLDQEERLVATTEQPLARVGDFAYLRVAWVNEFGAFLDWGLMKDLFVPFREQKMRMEKDRSYIVYVYIDEETQRIAATAKVEKHLRRASHRDYRHGQTVDLLVQQKTPLGFKVIADNAVSGMIYDNQLPHTPHTGDRLTGTVVFVRQDGKLDIVVGGTGKERFLDFAEQLEEELRAAGGLLPFTDKSSADDIAERFGVSKKTFKKAVGTLYRQQKIILTPSDIRLNEV